MLNTDDGIHLQNAIFSNLSPPSNIFPAADIEIYTHTQIKSTHDEQLNMLNDIIANLSAKRTEAIKNIAIHELSLFNLKSLSAPYRRIPAEIIGEIFMQCIPNGTCEHNLDLDAWFNLVQIFTQVCYLWSSIAKNTSRIWKYLDIELNAQGSKKAIYILKKWTSTMPANNLELRINSCHGITTMPRAKRFYALLNNNQHLKTLTLTTGGWYLFTHLRALVLNNLPNLETFYISEHTQIAGGGALIDNLIYLRAPKLTQLSLTISFMGIFDARTLRNITILSLKCSTYQIEDFLEFLRYCPNITEVQICILRTGLISIDSNPSAITLYHLKKLYLYLHEDISILLELINAPELTELILIRQEGNSINSKLDDIILFITSTKKLSELNILGTFSDKEKTDFDHTFQRIHPSIPCIWQGACEPFTNDPFRNQFEDDETTSFAENNPETENNLIELGME
jgi:hypothetical protein